MDRLGQLSRSSGRRVGVFRSLGRLAAAGAVWFWAAAGAGAAPIVVPVDYPTVQAAVDAAGPGDVILLAPGVYPGPVRIDGKAITIEGGAAATLDGGGQPGTVLTVQNASGVVVRGVTIRNGRGTLADTQCWPFGAVSFGGGVRVVGGQATFRNVVISGNEAVLGGGLWYEQGAAVSLEECEISGNLAVEIAAAVGGCWLGPPGTLTMSGCTVAANRLTTTQSQYGVVTPGPGDATIASTLFTGNFDTLGVLHTPQRGLLRLVVRNSTFRGNTRLFGSLTIIQGDPLSSALVEGCTFEDEAAGAAGGRGGVVLISNSTDRTVVRDCTFTNVVTGGVEFVLQGGGSLVLEGVRMDRMPDASFGGVVTAASSLVVRDVRTNGGITGSTLLIRDGSRVRLDRVRIGPVDEDALVLNVAGGGDAEVSNLLVTGAGDSGLEVVALEPTPEGPDNRVRLSNITLSRNFIGLNMTVANFGEFTLANSILAGNTLLDLLPSVAGAPVARYSLIVSGHPGVGIIDAPPGFADPDADDYRLSAFSPALDAGDNDAIPADATLDLDGRPRRTDSPAPDTGVGAGAPVDLGAFETSFGPAACSLADIVSIGGFPPADGELTVDDYTSFINAFAGDELLADIVSIGGFPPPDGELTVDDYTSFVNAFAEGCPG